MLEAMKMENVLRAERDGTVAEVKVAPRDTVAALAAWPGRSLRLRRRDAEDLVLVLASRYAEWKHTAEVHADPHLVAILQQPGDDHGPVRGPRRRLTRS